MIRDYAHPISENGRKAYCELSELLKHVSYKPGWKIVIREDPSVYGFVVEISYDGYESENAAFIPVLPEGPIASSAREKLAVSIGKTVRQPEKRYFRKSFDSYILENMSTENILKYIIAQTIKEAEMFEFDRWFKYDGCRVFEEGK